MLMETDVHVPQTRVDEVANRFVVPLVVGKQVRRPLLLETQFFENRTRTEDAAQSAAGG